MSTTAYTQDGPWFDAGLTGNNPIVTGGPLRLIKSDDVVVAFLPPWLDSKSESTEAQANARLIAAAPTMYEYIASSASNGCHEAQKILEAINAGR